MIKAFQKILSTNSQASTTQLVYNPDVAGNKLTNIGRKSKGQKNQCFFCEAYSSQYCIQIVTNSVLGNVMCCTKNRTSKCINKQKTQERAKANSEKGSSSERPLFGDLI